MPQARYHSDRRGEDYIKSLPSWQQDVCWQVRDLVHAADPDVSEAIKRTKLAYFTLEGNICALFAAKDHVNVFIYDPIAPDPEGIVNLGQGNRAARAIRVYQGEPIKKRALLKGSNCQQPGWRLAPLAAQSGSPLSSCSGIQSAKISFWLCYAHSVEALAQLVCEKQPAARGRRRCIGNGRQRIGQFIDEAKH